MRAREMSLFQFTLRRFRGIGVGGGAALWIPAFGDL